MHCLVPQLGLQKHEGQAHRVTFAALTMSPAQPLPLVAEKGFGIVADQRHPSTLRGSVTRASDGEDAAGAAGGLLWFAVVH